MAVARKANETTGADTAAGADAADTPPPPPPSLERIAAFLEDLQERRGEGIGMGKGDGGTSIALRTGDFLASLSVAQPLGMVSAAGSPMPFSPFAPAGGVGPFWSAPERIFATRPAPFSAAAPTTPGNTQGSAFNPHSAPSPSLPLLPEGVEIAEFLEWLRAFRSVAGAAHQAAPTTREMPLPVPPPPSTGPGLLERSLLHATALNAGVGGFLLGQAAAPVTMVVASAPLGGVATTIVTADVMTSGRTGGFGTPPTVSVPPSVGAPTPAPTERLYPNFPAVDQFPLDRTPIPQPSWYGEAPTVPMPDRYPAEQDTTIPSTPVPDQTGLTDVLEQARPPAASSSPMPPPVSPVAPLNRPLQQERKSPSREGVVPDVSASPGSRSPTTTPSLPDRPGMPPGASPIPYRDPFIPPPSMHDRYPAEGQGTTVSWGGAQANRRGEYGPLASLAAFLVPLTLPALAVAITGSRAASAQANTSVGGKPVGTLTAGIPMVRGDAATGIYPPVTAFPSLPFTSPLPNNAMEAKPSSSDRTVGEKAPEFAPRPSLFPRPSAVFRPVASHSVYDTGEEDSRRGERRERGHSPYTDLEPTAPRMIPRRDTPTGSAFVWPGEGATFPVIARPPFTAPSSILLHGAAPITAPRQATPASVALRPEARFGQVTLVAPPFLVGNERSRQAGAAVRMEWPALARGAGALDAAGLKALRTLLPPEAALVYPALPVGQGTVNLALAPSLLGPLLERAYGPVSPRFIESAALLGSAAVVNVAAPLVAPVVPTPERPPGSMPGLLPGAGAEGAARDVSALTEAGAGSAARGGPLDFLGMPVRLAPSLAGRPELREEAEARGVVTRGGGRGLSPVSDRAFLPLRDRLFGSLASVESDPDSEAWRRAAPSFGLQDARPAALLSPDVRVPRVTETSPLPQVEDATAASGSPLASFAPILRTQAARGEEAEARKFPLPLMSSLPLTRPDFVPTAPLLPLVAPDFAPSAAGFLPGSWGVRTGGGVPLVPPEGRYASLGLPAAGVLSAPLSDSGGGDWARGVARFGTTAPAYTPVYPPVYMPPENSGVIADSGGAVGWDTSGRGGSSEPAPVLPVRGPAVFTPIGHNPVARLLSRNLAPEEAPSLARITDLVPSTTEASTDYGPPSLPSLPPTHVSRTAYDSAFTIARPSLPLTKGRRERLQRAERGSELGSGTARTDSSSDRRVTDLLTSEEAGASAAEVELLATEVYALLRQRLRREADRQGRF